MAQFAGKWKLDKCENMDGFMKAMGAPEEFVKKALEAKEKEVIEFVVNGNTFNVKSEVMKFNHTFELGKEFEETGPMGKKSKNIAKLEGDKLITDSKLEDGKELHMERRVEGNRMIVEMKSCGATCRNEFVKI